MIDAKRYVHVRCTIRNGAFSTEYLVIIETQPQNHVGFVPKEYVDIVEKNSAVIEGRVMESDDEGTVTIKLPGSFVENAMGIFSFSKDWAESNILPAELAKETV